MRVRNHYLHRQLAAAASDLSTSQKQREQQSTICLQSCFTLATLPIAAIMSVLLLQAHGRHRRTNRRRAAQVLVLVARVLVLVARVRVRVRVLEWLQSG